MRRIFLGFCKNPFVMSPLHYLSSRFDFAFEFAEIFAIEKRLPDYVVRESTRLPIDTIFSNSKINHGDSTSLAYFLLNWSFNGLV